MVCVFCIVIGWDARSAVALYWLIVMNRAEGGETGQFPLG